jgi:hypothetical protein
VAVGVGVSVAVGVGVSVAVGVGLDPFAESPPHAASSAAAITSSASTGSQDFRGGLSFIAYAP